MNSGEESSNTSLLLLWQNPFFLTCIHKDYIARVCGKPSEVIQLCFFISGVIRLSVSALSSLLGQIQFHLPRFAHQLTLIFHFFLIWCLSYLYFLSSLPFLRMLTCHAQPCNIFLLSLLVWVWSPLCICVSSYPGCPAPADLCNIRGAFGRRCQRLAVLPRLEVSSNSCDPCWEWRLCCTRELAVR